GGYGGLRSGGRARGGAAGGGQAEGSGGVLVVAGAAPQATGAAGDAGEAGRVAGPPARGAGRGGHGPPPWEQRPDPPQAGQVRPPGTVPPPPQVEQPAQEHAATTGLGMTAVGMVGMMSMGRFPFVT